MAEGTANGAMLAGVRVLDHATLGAVGVKGVLVDAAHVKAAEAALARSALIDPTRLAPSR
jgi:hypothetical protein